MKTILKSPLRVLATISLIVNVFAGTLMLTACPFGGDSSDGARIAAIRAALKASPALVEPLVQSGVLTRAQADGVIKDFTDAGDIALVLKTDFDAIPSDLTKEAAFQAQYKAVHKAYQGWVAIVNRGHFGVHPAIRTAFSIADGIWLFVDAFYADQAGMTSHADVGADGLSEKEFRDALDSKINELKEAMKPQK
jgi:hypothetical protein